MRRNDACTLCRAPFAEGDVVHAAKHAVLCEDCAAHLTAEELLYLAGAETPRELLPLLGFSRRGA